VHVVQRSHIGTASTRSFRLHRYADPNLRTLSYKTFSLESVALMIVNDTIALFRMPISVTNWSKFGDKININITTYEITGLSMWAVGVIVGFSECRLRTMYKYDGE